MKNILLSAGGTGGHLSPALNLAKILHKEKYKITFITDDRCKKYLPKDLPYKIHILKAAPFSKKPSKFIEFLFYLLINILKTNNTIFFNRINKVISFGGYTGISSNIAAILCFKILILHEQNSVIGRSNLFFAKFAKYIACNFPKLKKSDKFKKKIIYTGNFIKSKYKASSSKSINIVSLGGSQGAKFVTDITLDLITSLDKKIFEKINLTVQARSEFCDKTTDILKKTKINYVVKDYFNDMEKRIFEADLVIARSGASSMAEIIFFNKASILIPYIYSSDNHQLQNAKFLSDNDATILLEEKKYQKEKIQKIFKNLIVNKSAREVLEKNLKKIVNNNKIDNLLKYL